MHQSISIYLAGNIQKEHEKESQVFWTCSDQEVLREGLAPYQVTFLNPAQRTDDLTDQQSVFGRDMTQVFFADIVFVDARERRGLGVGAEMMWAKINGIPVVTLAPANTHYKKDNMNLLGVPVKNWVHPFVECLSDELIEDLTEGVLWVKKMLAGDALVKGPESITEAMLHYQETQLPKDLPMQELLGKNPPLKQRIGQFCNTV
ncbi:MAG: hypothetical protein SP1CHLAM54_12820 [Chlamydiia bacterium]|nr:hypothetical protein [Chlamydiia bacterium]MCH9616179.1 hypothetical protein [Chlamydiia bacterium]MCH9629835.1 hypothetical protein [Chlamydiia bacterium]